MIPLMLISVPLLVVLAYCAGRSERRQTDYDRGYRDGDSAARYDWWAIEAEHQRRERSHRADL